MFEQGKWNLGSISMVSNFLILLHYIYYKFLGNKPDSDKSVPLTLRFDFQMKGFVHPHWCFHMAD